MSSVVSPSPIWDLIIILVSIILRHAISLHPHSGMGRAPMFGDLEAQRHWMEVTLHLPRYEWYHHTADNDLLYWGLDYPPLTAYHSLAMGHIAARIDPAYVALHDSRGIETPSSKLFLRTTVLLSDLLLFIPAVFTVVPQIYPKKSWAEQRAAIAFLLGMPGLMLIDHGHFQYNCVSLGLVLWALVFFLRGRDLLSAVFFTLSLCYKQMSLYFAPAFFIAMLGRAVYDSKTWSETFERVIILGGVVAVTAGACFAPLVVGAPDPLAAFVQILHRIFPFARGLYEDKVANFWCVSSIAIKWAQRFDRSILVRLCLATTLLSLLPAGFLALRRNTPHRTTIIYLLTASSLSFFLFSFHVHEKSIMFPLLSAALLCLRDPLLASWFSHIATFSMYPLLVKDGLMLPYFAGQVLSAMLTSYLPPDTAHSSRRQATLTRLSQLSLVGATCIHMFMVVAPKHPRYPDLNDLLVAVYSSVHFIAFWAMCIVDLAMVTTKAAIGHHKTD